MVISRPLRASVWPILLFAYPRGDLLSPDAEKKTEDQSLTVEGNMH